MVRPLRSAGPLIRAVMVFAVITLERLDVRYATVATPNTSHSAATILPIQPGAMFPLYDVLPVIVTATTW